MQYPGHVFHRDLKIFQFSICFMFVETDDLLFLDLLTVIRDVDYSIYY